MSKVVVHRFRFYNRQTRAFEDSTDYATERAIAQIGATILPGTAREVEARLVGSVSGYLISTHRLEKQGSS